MKIAAWIFVVISLVFTSIVFASTNDLGVPTATKVVNAAVVSAVDAATANLPAVKEGWGKQIGIALKEAVGAFDGTLSVTEDHVYKFTNTGIGKVTVAIIVWKIIGHDILGIIFGTTLVILAIWGGKKWGTVLWCNHLVIDGIDEKGKKKYKAVGPIINDNSSSDEMLGVMLAYICIIGGSMTVGLMLIFN
jgi:hypothetical protein